MLRTIIIFTLVLLCCFAHPHDKIGACPDNIGLVQHGKLFHFISDHLTVSSNENLKLTNGEDSLCYNHTLANVFQNRPGIAICIIFNLSKLSMIFKVNSALINFSLLDHLKLIIMVLYHSLLELTGNILHGIKFHLVSLLKIKIILKLVIIKSILDHLPDVILENKLMFYFLLEQILEEAILNSLLIFMDLKSHPNQT